VGEVWVLASVFIPSLEVHRECMLCWRGMSVVMFSMTSRGVIGDMDMTNRLKKLKLDILPVDLSSLSMFTD